METGVPGFLFERIEEIEDLKKKSSYAIEPLPSEESLSEESLDEMQEVINTKNKKL